MQTTTKVIPVKFRFPVNQINENTVEVCIPVSTLGMPITKIVQETATALKLSDKEFDKAQDAAEEAALRSILIVE